MANLVINKQGGCLEMTTHKDKVYSLKNSIVQLYEKEGRSKSYIAKLLELDRKALTTAINEEWKLVQGKGQRRLTPSNAKFLARNKQFIKSKLDQDYKLKDIAVHLGVSVDYLTRTIIANDKVLARAKEDKQNRESVRAIERKNSLLANSKLRYYKEGEIPDERWRPIKGHKGYEVSDYGRVRSFKSSYNKYVLLSLNTNPVNGYNYIKIGTKGLKVSRLVAFNFVEGYSDNKNTVEHKNNKRTDDHYKNLMWVSQGENNKLAYEKGRAVSRRGSRTGKFKEIVVDGKYKFKTIRAFAKWTNVSESQAHRYINKETEYHREIKLVY